jgi:hypothetical protein
MVTQKTGTLRSSILNNWNGSLNSQFIESLWDYTGGQQYDGSLDTNGNDGRACVASNTSHFKVVDGTSSATAHPLKTGDSFAFSLWIQPKTNQTEAIFSKYNSSAANQEYYVERVDRDLKVYMVVSSSVTTATATAVFPAGSDWHHLAIDFNGYTMRIYLDGDFKTTLSFPDGNEPQSGNFTLGRKAGFSTYSDDAYLKLGFWKSAGKGGFLLGQTGVDILYNSGLGMRYNSLPVSLKGSLISYWNMHETTGNAADSHGSSPLVSAGGASPVTATGPDLEAYTADDYVQKNLATTSLKPTLHLGSRNMYVATGRQQAL